MISLNFFSPSIPSSILKIHRALLVGNPAVHGIVGDSILSVVHAKVSLGLDIPESLLYFGSKPLPQHERFAECRPTFAYEVGTWTRASCPCMANFMSECRARNCPAVDE